MSVELRLLREAEILPVLDDLAALRIRVFREWPYLYDGDLEYERRYLEPYARSGGALVVGAFDGARMVGAATASLMEDHAKDFAQAFEGTDIPLETIFYCAESVLLPEYRGRGLGHRFFEAREAEARALGRQLVAFCAVMRAGQAPTSARDLGPFWRGRGYAPIEGVIASFAWKDVGAAQETEKQLQFWGKVCG